MNRSQQGKEKGDKSTMVNKNGFTGPSTDNIDPILLEFVKTRANSFVKWELMRFFGDNPHTTNTAENIASYVGRRVPAIKSELEDLVQSGVMKKQGVNGASVYLLASDANMRALIDKFTLALEDRHFRAQAIDHILPGRR